MPRARSAAAAAKARSRRGQGRQGREEVTGRRGRWQRAAHDGRPGHFGSQSWQALPLQIIVGLGNPGAEHAAHASQRGLLVRRRAGAPAWRARFAANARYHGEICRVTHRRASELWLLKPMTFMNRSGSRGARAAATTCKFAAGAVLVVHDELDLPRRRRAAQARRRPRRTQRPAGRDRALGDGLLAPAARHRPSRATGSRSSTTCCSAPAPGRAALHATRRSSSPVAESSARCCAEGAERHEQLQRALHTAPPAAEDGVRWVSSAASSGCRTSASPRSSTR